MASFNKVILMGNLTRDVEVKYTANQTAVTEIGLAINDRRKGQDGQWQEETTFVDVTLWGRTAEVAGQYLKKGSGVLIDGRLRLDQWQDKQTGQQRSQLRVTGDRMQMLPRTGGDGIAQQGGYQDNQSRSVNRGGVVQDDRRASYGTPPANDDIPF